MSKFIKPSLYMHLMSMLIVAVAILTTSSELIELFNKENDYASQLPLNVLAASAQNINSSVSKYHPLSIEHLRILEEETEASNLIVKQKLANGPNYTQSVVSYKSSNWNINALLTVPIGDPPEGGWPVIIFNHGWIPPKEYKTTERYEKYIDSLAKNGYVVVKPDYRGHGDSEGYSTGTYTSHDYVIDVLNLYKTMSVQDYVNPSRIGMWGHSMGGFITLKSLIVNPDIKAAVVWGGVLGEYKYILDLWGRPEVGKSNAFFESNGDLKYPTFWNYISPITHVATIKAPIQLHHGLADEVVPWHHSEDLKNALIFSGKYVEIYTYPNGDHNLSGESFDSAMQRSIEFFDRYLRSTPSTSNISE